MKQLTEAQMLKEIRQAGQTIHKLNQLNEKLEREARQQTRAMQALENENKGLERRNRDAEQKIDYLNKLLKTNSDTITELRESLEHARSLHPFNP